MIQHVNDVTDIQVYKAMIDQDIDPNNLKKEDGIRCLSRGIGLLNCDGVSCSSCKAGINKERGLRILSMKAKTTEELLKGWL